MQARIGGAERDSTPGQGGDEYLSIDRVAKRVGVSRDLIYEEVKAGRLKALAIGKKPSIRIHVDEPARWEKEQGYYDYER